MMKLSAAWFRRLKPGCHPTQRTQRCLLVDASDANERKELRDKRPNARDATAKTHAYRQTDRQTDRQTWAYSQLRQQMKCKIQETVHKKLKNIKNRK